MPTPVVGGDVTEHQHPSRFHRWFEEQLTAQGWGDREAGRRIGINHVTVGGIRNGSTRNPTRAVLRKISQKLGEDVQTLEAWLADPPPATSQDGLGEGQAGGAILTMISSLRDPALELAFYRALSAASDPGISPKHKRELEVALITSLKMMGRWDGPSDSAG